MKKFCPKYFFPVLIVLWSACSKQDVATVDYREEMRSFVQQISAKGKSWRAGFVVIPQNGLDLLTTHGGPASPHATAYLQAIDGVGQEEVFYGYDNNDDVATPTYEHTMMLDMCRFANLNGKKVLLTDYATTPQHQSDAYNQYYLESFLGFVADHRDLDDIPPLPSSITTDTLDIDSLYKAQNFLYLINPSSFTSKEEFLDKLAATPYDLIVMDLSFDESTQLTSADLDRIRIKPQGGRRMLICYMSIGEAENYRSYWKNEWYAGQPSFLVAEDPSWVDNYFVKYWDPSWQQMICGDTDSYLRRVIDAGFDGVYLDKVDAYEFFEEGK